MDILKKDIIRLQNKNYKDIYKYIISYSKYCDLNPVYFNKDTKVQGCNSNTYILCSYKNKDLRIQGYSEGLLSNGILGYLISNLKDLSLKELSNIDYQLFNELDNIFNLSMSRANGFYNITNKIKIDIEYLNKHKE